MNFLKIHKTCLLDNTMQKKIYLLILFTFFLKFSKGQSTLEYFNNTAYSVQKILTPTGFILPQAVVVDSTEPDFEIEIIQNPLIQRDNRGVITNVTLNFEIQVSKWVNLRRSGNNGGTSPSVSNPRGGNTQIERVLINLGFGNHGSQGTVIVTEIIQVGSGRLIYQTPTGIFTIPINIFISPSTSNL
ncbi:hypothetical protein [Cecembia calidifontis]|uniref:Uncharacterized protein n=1 Tax=Cecembia calidifontis TaxID=1187080 RepID=A0A4Q7P7F1_9BACT|nr:hypothetical protein [Cecembia calidifontis]RZS96063.1 hypothetical protein BC751_1619 [Cecembia calidifontis]